MKIFRESLFTQWKERMNKRDKVGKLCLSLEDRDQDSDRDCVLRKGNIYSTNVKMLFFLNCDCNTFSFNEDHFCIVCCWCIYYIIYILQIVYFFFIRWSNFYYVSTFDRLFQDELLYIPLVY